MDRKHTFFHVLFFSLFLFSTGVMCFGDTSEQLLQAKEQIVGLIDHEDFAAAELAISQMKLNFTGHSDLPERLYEVGRRYLLKKGDTPRFRSMCEEIVTDFPDFPIAICARMHLSRLTIEDLIDQGDVAAAEAAISQMESDYAGDKDLSARLCEIATKYREKGDIARYHSLCEHIASQYPKTPATSFVRLYIASCKIKDLIDQGDHESVNTAISQMKSDFFGRSSLPPRLCGIARKYAKENDKRHSRIIFQQVVDEFPESSSVTEAQMYLLRFSAEELIEHGDIEGAENEILQMETEFSEHPDLPSRLWDVANRYYLTGEISKANALCQRIITKYNPNERLYALCVAKLAAYKVLDLIGTSEIEVTDAVISQIKMQFTDTRERSWALFIIAEELYKKGQRLRRIKDTTATECFNKSISIIENDILEIDDKGSFDIWYLLGLNYWEFDEWLAAQYAFNTAIQINPDNKYVTKSYLWISKCYEKLKAANQVTAEQADRIIEGAYQNIFDNYPNCPDAMHAAIRLAQINLVKNEQMKAALYINYIIGSTSNDPKQVDFILNRVIAEF